LALQSPRDRGETIPDCAALQTLAGWRTGLTASCELDSTVSEKGIVISGQEIEDLNITRQVFQG